MRNRIVTMVNFIFNQLSVMKYFILLAVALLYFGDQAQAQFGDLGSNRVATSSFQFLKIGVGAREVSMGETGITITNDANALFWNPSHITFIPEYSTSFSYNKWYADIWQTSAATTFKLSSLADFKMGTESLSFIQSLIQTFGYLNYGISVNYLTTAPMNRTTTLQPFGTGEKFNYYDLAIGLTIASQMTEQFAFGITPKYVREQLAEVEYTNFLFDLGMTYIMDENDTKLSIVLMNFGTRSKPTGKINVADIQNPVTEFQDYNAASTFRLGYSMIPFKTDDHQILTAFQLNHPNDGAENYALGLEYGFLKTFFLRSGLKLNVEGQSFPSFGFGINKMLLMFDLKLDYGVTNIDKLGFAHRITLSLNLPEGDIR